MKTKLMRLGAATAIAALMASPAFAQSNNNADKNGANNPTSAATNNADNTKADTNNATSKAAEATTPAAGGTDEVRASKLVGSTVYNQENQTVGTLDDILLTHDTKQPVQAIISVGGFLGIGSKLVEVGYDQLKLDENNKVVMPNASRDELKKMQTFSYNTLAHSGTTNASGSTATTTGTPPSTATTATGAGMGTTSGAGTAPPPATGTSSSPNH